MAPLVSVGMPVYNAEQTLRETLDSILGQTCTDMELVISDNASTDGTRTLCEDYAARDSRVHYLHNPENLGASENYNKVFRQSRGKYFKWASSNDTCHPAFLERCLDVLRRDDTVVIAHPLTRIHDEAGLSEDLRDNLDLRQDDPCIRFRLLLERMRLNNVMNGVIRSDVLRRTPLIRPFFASDVSLMAELALHGKFAEVPEYLFFRRMDAKTATARKPAEEVAAHFNPKTRRAPKFSTLRVHAHYLGAIWRAPIGMRARWCLHRYVARSFIWQRTAVMADVRQGLSSLIRA